MKKHLILLLVVCSFSVNHLQAQTYMTIYEPEDWVTYVNHRYITAIGSEIYYMYFATKGGLAIYNEIGQTWETYWLPKPIYRIGVSPFWLYLEVHPRYVEAGDWQYIWFEKDSKEWKYGFEPTENVAWFGGELNEEVLYNKFPFVHSIDFLDKHLRSNNITSWAVDDQGLYAWIGTDGGGLFKYDIRTGWFEKTRFGLLDDQVNAMIQVDQTIWFAGRGEKHEDYRGLTIYDKKEDQYIYLEARYMPKLPTATVFDMAQTPIDVWLGTPHGLVRFNKKKNGWQVLNTFNGLSGDEIYAVETTGLYVWVGAETGLDWLRLDKKGEIVEKGRVDHPKLSYLSVYDLDSVGETVWAATADGAYRYTLGDTAWVHASAPAAQLVGTIYSVCVDEADEMVYFANEEGLVRYDMIYKEWDSLPFYTVIPENYGRDFPIIKKIKADADNLWLGTDNGVWRYSKTRDAWHKYMAQGTIDRETTYVSESPLVSNDINDIMIDGDYVWFATDEGATRFYWNDTKRTW